MIFLTLGTQLGFDRLVKAVDEIAPHLDEEVFGQIGPGKYKPKNFAYTETLGPKEFSTRFDEARIVIGHAGIGTILSGLKAEKPLILMARIARLGEHRNDHQLATVEQIRKLPGVYIAENGADIIDLVKRPSIEPMRNEVSRNRMDLVSRLRAEIFSG